MLFTRSRRGTSIDKIATVATVTCNFAIQYNKYENINIKKYLFMIYD